MDMLAATGFVNYFGKVPNLDQLKFQPILLKKGDTYVSIYGIGSMNDDRLFRLFQEEKVFVYQTRKMLKIRICLLSLLSCRFFSRYLLNWRTSGSIY